MFGSKTCHVCTQLEHVFSLRVHAQVQPMENCQFIDNFMVVLSQRKPEEESSATEKEETEAPVKKARQDDEQVAQPTPAVTENGHAKN